MHSVQRVELRRTWKETMASMTDLDAKIKDIFPEESMHKTPDRYSFFSGVNVPSFIKDWLIKKFSIDDDIDTDGLYDFIKSIFLQRIATFEANF